MVHLALPILALCLQSGDRDGLVTFREVRPEFRVNHRPRWDQSKISLIAFRNDFLVAWTSGEAGLSRFSKMRFFSDPFEWTLGIGGHPFLSTNDRQLVLTWSQETPTEWRSWLRRYELAPVLSEHETIRLDPEGSEGVVVPSVGMYADGSFVVVWNRSRNGETNYFSQYFGPEGVGAGLGSPVLLNDLPGMDVDVGKDGRASVVVREVAGRKHAFAVWDQVDPGTAVATVKGRRLFPETGERGPEFVIDDGLGTHSYQRPIPDVDAQGEVVVAWSRDRSAALLRKFDATDQPLTPVLEVDGNDRFEQELARPMFLESGHFLLAWTRTRDVLGKDVLMTVYDPSCRDLRSEPYRVNDDTASWDQARPDLAAHFLGKRSAEVAVCWTSLLQDGDIRGVYAKVLRVDVGESAR